MEIDGEKVEDDPEVVVVLLVVAAVSVAAAVVVSAPAADVVSVDVGAGAVSVAGGDESVDVSVEPEDVPPVSATLPNAPAARKPTTKRATIATAVHDFF